MKRFYKLVSISAAARGHGILLDGKPVKTPGRQDLIAPTPALAEAIMQEWIRQVDTINPQDMPLTQILSTRIDRVTAERGILTHNLMKFLDTDLICYRAPEPAELNERQSGAWDPWIEWFFKTFQIRLEITQRLNAVAQSPAAHEAVRQFVDALTEDRFTVFQIAAGVTGSLVLPMALVENQISPKVLFDAAHIEEQYKATLYDEEKYGPDPAQEQKDASDLRDLEAAAHYIQLL